VPLRWCNYLFVVLLALIVNLSIRAVGILLINAMLVVPAATAANASRNLRQMFWLSMLLSLTAGIGGVWVSSAVEIPVGPEETIQLGVAGTIVVLTVLFFFATVAWRLVGRRPRGSLAVAGGSGENAIIGEPAPAPPA
jgi:zinc transport system permease protein